MSKKANLIILCLLGCLILKAQKGILTQNMPGSEQSFTLKLIPSTELKASNGKIVLLDSFYVGTHEVTHDLFVMFKRKESDTNASNLTDDYSPDAITRPTPPYEDPTWGMGNIGGYPAVSMTQQSALRFCEWLYYKTGRFYRLPTEAEWTLVAQMYGQQNSYDEAIGVFDENSYSKYEIVGSQEGEKDIFDLYGNVLEWTLDSWENDFLASYEDKNISNPWIVPTKKNFRVLKGGSFFDSAKDVDANTRFKSKRKWQERDPQIPKSKWWLTDGSFIGFRLVSPVLEPNSEEIKAFFEKAIVD